VDLTASMKSGVEFVQPIAEQAGVSLAFLADGDGIAIQGNENGLRQIILNIVCNAIRHTPAGGMITVSVQCRPRGIARVEIVDTGCGIPAGLLDRLMTQHGGEIRVSSRVNAGSTFQLEFPTL
jgi:signal transduction histidine kinase